jgi:cytochrome P450
METRPRLVIADPELIRLILTDKNGDFVSPPLNPLVNILQQGVSTLEGEHWAKRRRLITPAFHLEKLKVIITVKYAIELLQVKIRPKYYLFF